MGFFEIKTATIWPTRLNKRAFRRDAEFRDLCASVKAFGILQSVSVRRAGGEAGEEYELLIGYRRWRAAQDCQLALVPAIVVDWDDKDAAARIAAENFARKDLGPLESAESVALLADQGWTQKEISAQFRKPPAWVALMVNLSHALAPEWRKAAADAEHFASKWSAAHLGLVARLPKPTQEIELRAMVGDVAAGVAPEVPALDWLIGRLAKAETLLAGVPFDLEDADLYPAAGACVTCPKTTANAGAHLFADMDSKAANRCLDDSCMAEKLRRQSQRAAAELAGKAASEAAVFLHGRPRTDGKTFAAEPERVAEAKPAEDFERCGDGAKGSRIGIFVSGAEFGTAAIVKPAKAAGGGAGSGSGKRKAAEGAEAGGGGDDNGAADPLSRLLDKRKAEYCRIVRRALCEPQGRTLIEKAAAMALPLACVFGCDPMPSDEGAEDWPAEVKAAGRAPVKTASRIALRLLRSVAGWIGRADDPFAAALAAQAFLDWETDNAAEMAIAAYPKARGVEPEAADNAFRALFA